MTSPARAGAAATGPAAPDRTAALAARLAAVESGIRDDRHRQPASVVEAIARLWTAGASVPAVAAEAGVSPHIVRDRLRRAGVLRFRFREQHRHVQEVLGRRGAELVAAYLSGTTVLALAAEAGISDTTLRDYFVAEGVVVHGPVSRARRVLMARRVELIAAYEAGTPIRVLAARAGVTPSPVRTFLIAEGVALRHDRGRPRKGRYADG